MIRVVFLVDGFNLYQSIVDIGRFNNGLQLKWLDIHSLCKSYLPQLGKDTIIENIYYFSALAHYLNDPDVIQRHTDYIECLKSTGVTPVLGRFKYKDSICPYCKRKIIRYEEKETDVAISIKLCDVLFNNESEIIVLITGDTDFAPAVRHAQKHFPEKSIIFIFPFGRKNLELKQLAPASFKISKQSYINNQFPNSVKLLDGRVINKPDAW